MAHEVDRRLAAIMFTDIVGSTNLMAESERSGLRAKQRHRTLVRLHVDRYHGEFIEAPGDETLSLFTSALDAVNCALSIQAAAEAEPHLRLHIGIHSGDVLVEGSEVHGDGVNVASRICSLSEHGGLRVSGEIYQSIRNQPDIEATPLGDHELKNVGRPVAVYAMTGTASPPRAVPVAHERRRLGNLASVTAVTALLLALGLWLWPRPLTFMLHQTLGPSVSPLLPDGPAIVVLPFTNMSGDPEQEYFADGIAEDLITRLSEWRSFPVIARNSSFTYKGQAVDVKRVGIDLGVRYAVEGSVRRAGNRVRITAQLIDATTGHHLWAETYDRELRDIFAVQDEISENVVTSIVPELERVEVERAVRKEARNLDAYDYRLRGMWHFYRRTPQDNRTARTLFERSLEADSQYALSWMLLGATHLSDAIFEWGESRGASITELERAARSCVAIDDQLVPCQIVLAWSHMVREEIEKAIVAAERAVRLNPNHLEARGWLGMMLTARGRPEEGIPQLEQALRLSPKDPQRDVWLVTLAWAHFAAGRYEQAVEWARRTLQHDPDNSWGYAALATSYGQLGRTEEARAALEEALRIDPDLTVAKVRRRNPGTDPELLERWLDGLRSAGLKE